MEEDLKLNAILSYLVTSRLAWATWDFCIKNKTKIKSHKHPHCDNHCQPHPVFTFYSNSLIFRTVWWSEWEMSPIGLCTWKLSPHVVALFVDSLEEGTLLEEEHHSGRALSLSVCYSLAAFLVHSLVSICSWRYGFPAACCCVSPIIIGSLLSLWNCKTIKPLSFFSTATEK